MTDDVSTVLAALDDEGCREILTYTYQEPMTAQELADATDIPLSTVYRKLDRLTDCGLLSERPRVRPGEKDANQYEPAFQSLQLRLTDEGIERGRG